MHNGKERPETPRLEQLKERVRASQMRREEAEKGRSSHASLLKTVLDTGFRAVERVTTPTRKK